MYSISIDDVTLSLQVLLLVHVTVLAGLRSSVRCLDVAGRDDGQYVRHVIAVVVDAEHW